MAAFLVRALGCTGSGAGDLFNDDDGSIFEADIDKLATAGVTKGCNPPVNDMFCPHSNVTRGQMAAFLVRALGLHRRWWRIDLCGEHPQADHGRGDTRVRPPVNHEYCPTNRVTRGQMAAFLHRALGG